MLLTVPEDFMQYITKASGRFFCNLCDYSHAQKRLARNHIESQHFPNYFSYPCPHCDKIVGTQKALSRHIENTHKNK